MRLVVIGGGPAGVEAAGTAAPHADVTLVSDTPAGTWRYLASRVWLAAAVAGERDMAVIGARVAEATSAWQSRCATELSSLNVELVAGRGRLGAPGEVLVTAAGEAEPRRLEADAVIIATGSSASFPDGLAPDGERILTDEDLAALASAPESALVLGDGAAGFELCHILSLLGTAVTWLIPDEAPHTRLTPEVDSYLTRLLERQGVHVAPRVAVRRLAPGLHGATATTADGARYGADVAVLVSGRHRDPTAVGLAGEQLETDIYCQTKRHGVYLVGDPMVTPTASAAMAQARAAALHAVRRSSAPADTRHIVQTFMLQPQVAKLGRLATEGAHGSVTVALAETVAAHVHAAFEGFLTLAWDHGARVAGALAVAPNAAEILAPVAIAMRAGMRLDELAACYGPHPSVSELAALAARKAERAGEVR